MARSLRWCAWCNARIWKENRDIKRAHEAGCFLYCDRACAGQAKRVDKPKTQRVAEKAAYDREYRAKNRAMLKAKKAAHYQRTVDREKERERRKANMPRHVEYCRRPEYRAKKRDYDRRYRAEKFFGPFAESFLLLGDLDSAIAQHADRYEIYRQNGTLNKKAQRKSL